MKTLHEIRKEIINGITKGEIIGSDKGYSFAQIEELAAKEYAKQWVEYALTSSHEVSVTGLIENINKEIDAQ